jgi:hypothetical protein
MAGYLHRTATTAYPCYLPVLGEFSRSWSCKTCRGKNREKSYIAMFFSLIQKSKFKSQKTLTTFLGGLLTFYF